MRLRLLAGLDQAHLPGQAQEMHLWRGDASFYRGRVEAVRGDRKDGSVCQGLRTVKSGFSVELKCGVAWYVAGH